jgi:hypothetical protein
MGNAPSSFRRYQAFCNVCSWAGAVFNERNGAFFQGAAHCDATKGGGFGHGFRVVESTYTIPQQR